MLSKKAFGNLKNRYIAVLKKCSLINTFGTLALATMCAMPTIAFAATNSASSTITGMDATDGTEQANSPYVNYYNTNILTNEGIIQDGIKYVEPFKILYADNALVGMFGNSSEDYTFSNTGKINITNNDTKGFAFGMYAEATANTLNNSGLIEISTVGQYAKAHGMYAEGDGVNTINNTNQIKVTAGTSFSKAYGIWGQGTGTTTVQNDGSIDVKASNGLAIGMYTDGDDRGTQTLINTDNITVTGDGVAGMHTYRASTARLINDGIIEVSGVDQSTGMYTLNTLTSNTIINRNTIIVKNTGTSGDYAYGMRAYGGNVTLANYGTIETTATDPTASADAVGMIANTAQANSLNNYGTIKATAAGAGMAVGIASAGSGAYTFNNYGIIETTPGTGSAFEAYAFTLIGLTGKYSVGTWATTLQDWTVNDAVFGYDVGGAINLSNATIILRPKQVGDSFEFGVNYDFEHFIVSNNANVDIPISAIGTITTEAPFFKAVITGTSTANAKVRIDLDVNDTTTPGSLSSSQINELVKLQVNNVAREILQINLEDLYANLFAQNGFTGIAAGSETSDDQNKWQIFLNPYASSMDNSHYNYDGEAKGITLGASYRFSNKFSLGGHFDFNSSTFDATLMSLDSEVKSYAFGLHGTYKIMPQWYVIGQATASLSEIDSDYSLLNGTLAKANSSYDSSSLYFALSTGYVWNIASSETSMHSLTPEIGVNYLSTKSDSYALDWGPSYAIYNIEYSDSSYSAFYATAKLNWRSEWILAENSSVAFLASAGLRQKLTSDDIENDFRLLGFDYTTQSSEDDSTFLANLGFEINKNNFNLRLSYNGEYGSNQEVHSGNLKFSYNF